MARFSISNMLSGGLAGAGAAAPASGGNPWIIGGGAALGALSGLLGEEDPNDKISRQLMGEQIISAKLNNSEAMRQQRLQREMDRRNKVISGSLANYMRGANIARKMI